MNLVDNHRCFACGADNNAGLRIDWKIDGRTTSAEFLPDKQYQGWKDIVHGGILATLLDEAITRLAWIVCGGALTAEMKVRYLAPAKIGEKLFVFGEITSENRRIVEARSWVYREKFKGPVVARAEGKAVKI